MALEQEEFERGAAAGWLLGRVGVPGRWARLKADYRWMAQPRRGHWQVIRSHDPVRRTILLDGGTRDPVEVNVTYLAFSATAPHKTVILRESAWGVGRDGESRYLAVCPRGHERELAALPGPAHRCPCPGCGEAHPWEPE